MHRLSLFRPSQHRPTTALARTRSGAAAIATLLLIALAAPVAGAASTPRAVHPQIQVGGFPTGLSLDPATDTVYVGNGTDDDLSLITGRTCDSAVTTGCAQHLVAVTAGTDPIGSVVDPTTNTIYAINASSDSVAVIAGGTCDAANTTGCSSTPTLINVGQGPEFAALNPATRTLYVANYDSGTVSVVNLRACNASDVKGCGAAVVGVVHAGSDPFAVAVDVPSDTVYVTNNGSDTVTVINGRTCNGTTKAGCVATHREYVGLSPGGITVDERTNTVYVADETSSDVAMFSGATCDALNTTKCGLHAYRLAIGNGDRGIAVNELTDSIYVANTRADTVIVFSGRACNGSVHTGCAHAVARVGASPRRVVVDQATNTVYVTNADSNTVSMINGRTCNGTTKTGC